MLSQASVLIRYVTKKGATMKRRKRFRQGPARNAIQYTSGYASGSETTVAIPA